MTPAALSRITWTVDDRRAWLAAYADARRIARVRERRNRSERARHAPRGAGSSHYDFSVHADVLAARERDDRFFQAQERGTV